MRCFHLYWGISKRTPHKSWHMSHFGKTRNGLWRKLFAFFLLFRKEPYIQSGITVNEHQVKKQNCLAQVQSLQPEQHFLGFPSVRSFTSSKMLYSAHVLTEKTPLFEFSPVTHYGRDKTVNIFLFLSKTPCVLLYKVQRGKEKQ